MIIINGIEMEDGVDEPNDIERDCDDEATENVTPVTPPRTDKSKVPDNPVWQALAQHMPEMFT